MTDRHGALIVLARGDATRARGQALAVSTSATRTTRLVLDKWFTAQALSTRADTATLRSRRWRGIPDFTLANQSARARWSVRSRRTSSPSTRPTGAAIASWRDMILAADKLNPQSAARLVPPLGRWRRFEPGRSALMKAELERIVATPGLSKDVFEQASKSLA